MVIYQRDALLLIHQTVSRVILDYLLLNTFQYAKLILPHVGLVLLTCAYTVVGALIFYSVEQPHELDNKRRQVNIRRLFIQY